MAYSELIKNFSRIRPYMRAFYVFGFQHRMDYDAKSARSYDNERRRVESWLGDYLRFGQDEDGKRVFLSVDSRAIPHDPLYRAFKAKSFTDMDITLHFCLLDILSVHPCIPLNEIITHLESRFCDFESAPLPDESTLRKKLTEYESLGLVRRSKEGKQVRWSLTEQNIDRSAWTDAAAFFSEAAPLGVIGSYLLDGTEADSCFRFKHHYILNALDSEIMAALFAAMGEGKTAVCQMKWRTVEFLPLRLYLSTQTGRQYVLGWADGRFRFFRLDLLSSVKTGAVCQPPAEAEIQAFQSHLWGVGTSDRLHHVELTIHAEPTEDFVVQRLFREKRCGTVTEQGGGDWRFEADVYDALEMLPWIRTFIGRIVAFRCSDPGVEQRFREDLAAMLQMYGGEDDAVQ